ncbi:MAG: PAS domain S-box protein [Scytonematopsis contorta HA4267-MV1]|jgi:PAS domain S-box-containing protein|nr:PAS domain S-box protein [Scytonematopsis contorta HA4267-MV1]
MSEGMVFQLADGSVEMCNANAKSILGLSIEQIQGWASTDSIWQTIHEDGSPFPGETHPAIISLGTGKPCLNVVMGLYKPNGELTWISINSQPIFRNGESTPYAVLSSFTDITEQEKGQNKYYLGTKDNQLNQVAENKNIEFKINFWGETRDILVALQESEERLNAIINNSSAVIYVKDIQGRYFLVNRQFELLFYITNKEVQGKTVWDIFPQEVAKAVRANDEQVLESGTLLQFEETVFINGEMRTYIADKFLLYNANGLPYAICGISTDITERKRFENSLRRSERLYRTIVDNLPNGSAMLFDRELRYLVAGGLGLDAVGMTKEDFEGKTIWQVLPEETCAVIEPLYRQALAGEASVTEILFAERLYVTHLLPVRDEQQNVIAGFSITQDITESKQAEVALKQSDLDFRTLADTMPQMFWTAQPNGWLDYYNQRWYEYTGMTWEQTQGWGWKPILHPDDLQRCLDVWNESISTGKPYQIEYRFLRASDRQYRWHLGRAFPLRNEKGEIVKWFGSNTDIDDKKRTEENLRNALKQAQAAREEAERANRIKDEFLAVLSHELRTPLNPILGWAKLLKDGRLNAKKAAEALNIIERNAKLQVELIEDLLDVSRILRGKLVLNISTIEIESIVTQALDTIRLAAETRAIKIQTIFEADVGQVTGDPARLQQIVWNLLSNAVKFTPNGGRVEISLKRIDSNAQIRVSDTGKGISSKFLPSIFDYFSQEDGTITRQFGGLGLGLPIVRNLVELHGGTIEVNSPGVGKGATFTVMLPLAINNTKTMGDNQQEDASLDLSGIRILVVDDDPDSREFISFALEMYGAEVTTASSVSEALQTLGELKPDVLVSDIGMPQMDGYEFLRQIRKWTAEQGGLIPAIALTAYAGEFDQRQAVAAGFQMHISKPVEPDALAAAIMKLKIS